MSILLSLSQNPWKRVVSTAKGASVFLDDAAAEILHWSEEDDSENNLIRVSLGVYSLYADLNPIAKDLIAQASCCHVVIVCTKPLIGRCAERIATLLSDVRPSECHVFCSVSESMHEVYTPLKGGVAEDEDNSYSHYGEFQAMMKKWIKRGSGSRVTVSYIDLFHTEILPNLFCTPAYHDSLFSLIPSDIPLLQQADVDENVTIQSLYDIQFNHLPESFQKSIQSFVRSFNSFLSSLNVHEDIFSIGVTSGLLAEQLCAHEEARSRRKIASKRCSVLFIDRSLDLVTPCSRSSDYFSDRLLSQLPSLHTNSNDVAINMEPLSKVDNRYLVPGCIAHPGNLRAKVLLNSLTFSKQKEALMDLSRNLVETLSKEKIPTTRSSMRMGKPSCSQVKSFIEHFKNNPNTIMRHNQLLQFACGVIEVMEPTISKQWDRLCQDEQRAMQCLLNNDISVVKFIISLVDSQLDNNSDTPDHLLLPLCDLFALIVEFYSLVGEECYTHHIEEANLKESLAKLIMIRRKRDDTFLISIGFLPKWSLMEIKQRLNNVFEWFNSLGTAREDFTQFKDIFTSDSSGSNNITSFVSQVLESICDPARPELPDIRNHSQEGLSNILRSGFSLFMSSARPRPDNHPLLIVYIVGGVSINEVRALKEFRKPNFEIYLGANKILTTNKTISDLFTKRSFN